MESVGLSYCPPDQTHMWEIGASRDGPSSFFYSSWWELVAKGWPVTQGSSSAPEGIFWVRPLKGSSVKGPSDH